MSMGPLLPREEHSNRDNQSSEVRRKRLAHGFWYFLIPVLSLGWLTAIPFAHAGWRLRDRKVFLLAGIYAVLGVASFVLFSKVNNARGHTDWRATVGFLFQVILVSVACFQLSRLRRRVYPPVGGSSPFHIENVRLYAITKSDHRQVQNDGRFEKIFVAVYITFLSSAIVLSPFFLIRETLAQDESWIYFGLTKFYIPFYIAISLFIAGGLIYWFATTDKADAGLQVYLFLVAIIGNVWLGFGIWLTAVKLLHIPLAVASPRSFGLLVWWNLLHSIPLLDINSTLNWGQPVKKYDASIGWLLLTQQIVFLLTLARSIQILVSSTFSPPVPDHRKPSNTDGDPPSNGPAGTAADS
jgi:hypothetical protein